MSSSDHFTIKAAKDNARKAMEALKDKHGIYVINDIGDDIQYLANKEVPDSDFPLKPAVKAVAQQLYDTLKAAITPQRQQEAEPDFRKLTAAQIQSARTVMDFLAAYFEAAQEQGQGATVAVVRR